MQKVNGSAELAARTHANAAGTVAGPSRRERSASAR